MLHILSICAPIIQLTPDETIPFMLLPTESEQFYKFIMENDISFRVFDHKGPESDGPALRFNDYLSWDTYSCFRSFHIPMDILQSEKSKTRLLCRNLDLGYVQLCSYNKKYISALKCDESAEHKVILYGYDSDNAYFLGKEFYNGKLTTFQIPFFEMDSALADYPWTGEEPYGLFGMKLSEYEEPVTFTNLKSGLSDLLYGSIDQEKMIEARGIQGLQYFYEYILKYRHLGEQYRRLFYIINYIRSGCKLMAFRLKYLSSLSVELQSQKELTVISRESDRVYFTIAKGLAREIYSDDVFSDVYVQTKRIIDQFFCFVEVFIEDFSAIRRLIGNEL